MYLTGVCGRHMLSVHTAQLIKYMALDVITDITKQYHMSDTTITNNAFESKYTYFNDRLPLFRHVNFQRLINA